jgi:hypothetical protein
MIPGMAKGPSMATVLETSCPSHFTAPAAIPLMM